MKWCIALDAVIPIALLAIHDGRTSTNLSRSAARLHAISIQGVEAVSDAAMNVLDPVHVLVKHVVVRKIEFAEEFLGTVWADDDAPILVLDARGPPLLETLEASLNIMLADSCWWLCGKVIQLLEFEAAATFAEI